MTTEGMSETPRTETRKELAGYIVTVFRAVFHLDDNAPAERYARVAAEKLIKLERELAEAKRGLALPSASGEYGGCPHTLVEREEAVTVDGQCSLCALQWLAHYKRELARREGWKLVPVEPTDDMLAELRDYASSYHDQSGGMTAVEAYAAMLAACPEEPNEPTRRPG